MSSEMALISVCLLLLCWSSLTNANGAPTINADSYYVCEDVPEGGFAFKINASDPENDPLTYSISGTYASYFNVESSTGNVYLKLKLDREIASVMSLDASVSDGSQSRTKGIFIIVNDANDNKPIFKAVSYEQTVSENTPVGTTLFKVQAEDIDTGPAGTVSYSINASFPSSGDTVFTVDNLGNVILKENLNYTSLSTFYRLIITAKDGGGKCFGDEIIYQNTSVFAEITVVDVPDLDPQFIGTPYMTSVAENTAIGQSVLAVTAIDQDTGINDDIIYSIEESALFIIDQKGFITVKSEIDREVIGDIVELTVKATERNLNIHGVQASATAQVRITITDVNDNSPGFFKCADECVAASSFSGEVKENSLGIVFINMTVKDADKNSQTELSLDGEYKDTFSVEPAVAFSSSTVQLIVKRSEVLDYEKMQQISLKVIAVDQGNSTYRATADVTINILDINDNIPEFANDTYYAKVPEQAEDGTTIATITATDLDLMDVDKITYKLLPTNMQQYFDVEPKTGRVFVKNGALLDRESRALYSVTLQALDSEGKPGNTVLEITVTDINDETPVPNRNPYRESVYDGTQLENVKIEATDGDEQGTPNSMLVFTIEPGPFSENFTINADTGVLSSKVPLDRESIDPSLNGEIQLKVKISDKGQPPLFAVVNVSINVQDVNDNKPVFKEPSYRFSVKESEKGVFVGSVNAEDHDQTSDFNRISFNIIEGALASFTIRTAPDAPGYIGRINVDQDTMLDYEGQKTYNLVVEAVDFGQEKATVEVEVIVLDVNDERPTFEPIPPVTVEENSKETGPIGTFTAVDKDGNHSLIYKQLSVKCRCSGEYTPCDWFVVEMNGSVTINPDAQIDYESCDQAIVEADVVDEYTEKGEANSLVPGEMVINILDMNDNTPEFVSSNSVFVLLSETASQGTSVAEVSATDRDSGANGQIEFQVSKVQFVHLDNKTTDMSMLFEAITTQQKNLYVGIIQSTEKLNTQLQGKYLVTVVAKDTGDLTNTSVLGIFVVDDSYKNKLRFNATEAEIKAQQNEIERDLMAVTQAAVRVVSVKEETSRTARASAVTVMEVYFINANGTGLPPKTVEKTLSLPENFQILSKYRLIYVGTVDPVKTTVNPWLYVLYGMVAGLIVVTAILTTSLVCTRRNYGRKLKAANAAKSVSAMFDQKGGPVVPGTNLYTMEGANPVLNLNIDAALDMGEDSDVDKVSLSSLDNSEVATVFEKDTNPIMKKTQKEDKDDEPKYIEPLGAALAQRDQKIRSNNPLLGDDNPIFDTTDL
ncbi:hypothetical protein NL108_011827 [Boleophthalmus pectinirostris]|nr:hypothetical protein NL108_011827 [Boleophthalmus pectinirostris]